ncbi:hypothetical protein J7355_08495 [Endozoicomonas sp. G2_2]|uniref:hypothetical protein n=1 Tax=Endozoicomonas sp. G2_2 TaxID=2821092 RepID=UPI001ADB54C1|nr:hypothetical protein [Endozoicomonas sp. G2_2]MBO9470137.1 hypothetical protein [Endozoicomonas sp. G2_2]
MEYSEDWYPERQREWQHKRLLQLAESAREGCRHYREAFEHIDFLEMKNASLYDSLAMLPLLGKAALKEDLDAFLNQSIRRYSESSTSGSTGMPTRVEHDLASIQRRFAFQADHIRHAGGAGILEPSVRLSGRLVAPPGRKVAKPWVYNAAEQQLFVSSYHLDDDHAWAICRRVEHLQPRVIDGYPSAILQLVRLLSRSPKTLSSLKAIVTTAETLQGEVKDELQLKTKAPVLDYYSASEGLPLVQQCRAGVYHVRWQSGILEVLTPDGVSDEGDGEIVATSFVQDRTPLIRYRTGDLVSGLKQQELATCTCGLTTPTVEGVVGRVEDLIYTPDGRALGMFTYRTLKYVDGLRESQVIQREYDRFQLRAVLVPGFDEATVSQAVKNSFERVLGYNIRLDTEIVEILPKGPNGKVSLVMSHVARKREKPITVTYGKSSTAVCEGDDG